MNDSTESEGHARGINTGSNNYGHTSRYNDTYTSSNPYYDNGSSGYNFRLVPIVDTDYHFYQIFFQIPNNTDIRGLGFRMDMDSDDHTVQLDEICLRPMNVRMSKTYTASALSNISLDDIVNA